MFAVQITRHAGSTPEGHVFDHTVRLLLFEGEVMIFHDEGSAQRIADHYTKETCNPQTICRKDYKVVPFEQYNQEVDDE